MPSARPMAEIFFRCAIEAGDAQAIRSLCSSKAVGIDVNDQVCIIGKMRFTGVERAARLQHFEATKILIELGADIGKTREHRDDESIHGALEHALYQSNDSATRINTGLVRMLLQAGGTFRPSTLQKLIDPSRADLVTLLISARISSSYEEWTTSGIFHRISHVMSQDTVLAIFTLMQAADADFEHSFVSGESDYAWEIPAYPPHIIDIIALRGDLYLLQILQRHKVSLTKNTLTAAVRSGNTELVQTLLRSGADADGFSLHFRSTPYAEALRLRDLGLLQLLGTKGCLNQITEEYRFCAALAAAAEVGDTALVEKLLSHGSDKNDQVLGYALAKATWHNQAGTAGILLDVGACTEGKRCIQVFGCKKPDDRSHYRIPPQHMATFPVLGAISNRNADLVRKLLEHDVDVTETFGYRSALPLAIEWGDFSVLKDLISVHRRIGWHSQPMAIAARKGDMQCIRLLLRSGSSADADKHDKTWPSYDSPSWDEPESPLTEAVRHNHIDAVRELLDNGADPATVSAVVSAMDVNSTDSAIFELLVRAYRNRYPFPFAGLSEALTVAIENEDRMIVQVLVDSKVISNYGIDGSRSPLSEAITRRNPEITRVILNSVPDINDIIRQSPTPETALLVAIGTNRVDMVQLILDHGAHVNRPATGGVKRTPVQRAAEAGSREIVQLLLDNNAEVNAPAAERGGGTALQLAATGGYIGVVELLLEHGGDLSSPASKVNGRYPIEGAAENGRFDMVKYLLDRRCHLSAELESAVRLAQRNGHAAIVELLESALEYADAPSVVHNVAQYFCERCEIIFSNASARARHNQTKHRENRLRNDFGCDICGRIFARKDLMVRHRATHDKSGYVQCPFCGRRFRKDYHSSHLPGCQQRHLESMEID